MYLSKAAKTRRANKAHANELAAAVAHGAQVMRLNETLQATNAKLTNDCSDNLRRAMIAESQCARQTDAIAAFKREALQASVEAAEMRGYIARTLEDDAVREVGGAKEAEPTMDPMERDQMQQMLHHDRHARRQPPRSIRSGPNHLRNKLMSEMNSGNVFTDACGVDYAVQDRRAMQQTAWLDR